MSLSSLFVEPALEFVLETTHPEEDKETLAAQTSLNEDEARIVDDYQVSIEKRICREVMVVGVGRRKRSSTSSLHVLGCRVGCCLLLQFVYWNTPSSTTSFSLLPAALSVWSVWLSSVWC
jgi:hypothetical protein